MAAPAKPAESLLSGVVDIEGFISAYLVAGRDLQQTGGAAAFQLQLPPAGRRGEGWLHG
jgi:hypothetical protein